MLSRIDRPEKPMKPSQNMVGIIHIENRWAAESSIFTSMHHLVVKTLSLPGWDTMAQGLGPGPAHCKPPPNGAIKINEWSIEPHPYPKTINPETCLLFSPLLKLILQKYSIENYRM